MYKAAMANNIDEMAEELLRNHYPLHFACMVGDELRVRELLSNGCFDVYQEDGCRAWTPMHWAAFGGHLGCLREVGHRPGSLEVRSRQTGETATHVAAQEGRTNCLHWVMQRSNGLSLQDYMGETPLHKAAKVGNLDCVKLLTPHTPALSIFNHDGQTALDVARQNGHSDCIAFLEQALCSQHSTFFPTNSSPILMNGEGIYQCQKMTPTPEENSCDQDMEMGEEVGAGGEGDAHAVFAPQYGMKRSFDDEDETSYKRPRLFAPHCRDKTGTATNNNILSSYNAVLAMSAEPNKSQLDRSACDIDQAHATLTLPCLPYPRPAQQWTAASQDLGTSSSYQDHCKALSAQIGYDSVMLQSLVKSDHGS